MFEWHSRPEVCFVFLHDVGATEDPYAPDSAFRQSEWFRRGWTLQELIAPSEVVFLSQNWLVLGTKRSFACVMEEITNIETAILSHAKELSSVSVARRMSWAASRKTTRVEDEAYSLMGLFGIYMPTIYGEGRNAFLRLREEILRRIPDQSIFAWGTCINLEDSYEPALWPLPISGSWAVPPGGLFATSPSQFDGCRLSVIPQHLFEQKLGFVPPNRPTDPSVTSFGVRIRLPLVDPPSDNVMSRAQPEKIVLGVLACEPRRDRVVALLLSPAEGGPDRYVIRRLTFKLDFSAESKMRALAIPLAWFPIHDVSSSLARSTISYQDVHLCHPRGTLSVFQTGRASHMHVHMSLPASIYDRSHTPAMWVIHLSPWTVTRLKEAGLTPALPRPPNLPLAYMIVLKEYDTQRLDLVNGGSRMYSLHMKSRNMDKNYRVQHSLAMDVTVSSTAQSPTCSKAVQPREVPQWRPMLVLKAEGWQTSAGSTGEFVLRPGPEGERVRVELKEWFPRKSVKHPVDGGFIKTPSIYAMDITILPGSRRTPSANAAGFN
ncbi:hypothetical protein L227DRAFT_652591 [Lentinus tigrinus ALCF2SS1-6]|uniref:DUF8212 domain-containing protein n=1 Tax=Lentinus tigrinus ALCF2SS1-6 TaxID=1328759 RepID=A0A5C2SDP1_9APHY|nr:hypothetical protein L227DRAFT_652591 [Lentinus tigrinus ALCF2SS1-6]